LSTKKRRPDRGCIARAFYCWATDGDERSGIASAPTFVTISSGADYKKNDFKSIKNGETPRALGRF